MRRLALLAALGLSCADESPTIVFVTIDGRPTLGAIDTLQVTLGNAGGFTGETYSLNRDQSLPLTLVVRPEGRTGELTVSVVARGNGQDRGRGSSAATIVSDDRVDLAVMLDPDDFVVNEEIALQQRVSFVAEHQGQALAVLPDGGFFAVWENACPLDRCDSLGRLFAADTSPARNATSNDSGEFILNSINEYTENPSIAAGPEAAIVAWQAATDAGSQRDIKATLLSFEGEHLDDSIVVSAVAESSEDFVAVLARDDGTFVVTWIRPRQPPSPVREVRARIIDGNSQLVGEEFVVSSATDGLDQITPYGVGLPGGGFVIVWVTGDGLSANVRGRVFGSDGQPLGDDFEVTDLAGLEASTPQVTATEDGFVVSWQVLRPVPASDDDLQPIKLKRFTAAGESASTEIVIAEDTRGLSSVPTLASLPDGTLAAAWEDDDELGDGNESSAGIRFRLFHPSGLASGDSFIANTTTRANQTTVAIQRLAADAFLLVYSDESTSTPQTLDSDVRGRVLYPLLERHDGQIGARCGGSGDPACGDGLICEDDGAGEKLCHPECVDGQCPLGGQCINNTFCKF